MGLERKLTFSMRSKEEAEEYRYFPDPDLPVVELDTAWVDGLRESLPELPDARKLRYREKLGLSEYDAEVLSMSGEASDFLKKFSKPEEIRNRPATGSLGT